MLVQPAAVFPHRGRLASAPIGPMLVRAMVASIGLQSAACESKPMPRAAASESDAAAQASDAGAEQAWSIIAIAAPLTTGDIALVLDADGQPHVAYSFSAGNGTQLNHAWVVDGNVQEELVDSYGRGRRKTWVTGSNELQLVYDHLSFSVSAFRAVQRSPGDWQIEVSNFNERSAASTALWNGDRFVFARQTAVFESGDVAPIVRHGLSVDGQPLPVAHTRVAVEQVEPALAMAVDGDGVIDVAYSAPSSDSRYGPTDSFLVPQVVLSVRYERGEWSLPEELTRAPGIYEGLSAGFDSNATLHVTYSETASVPAPDYDPVPGFKVHHLTRIGDAWTREEVVAAGKARLSRGSMALGLHDDVHLAFCLVEAESSACGGVGYAKRAADGWAVEVVDSDCGGLGSDASLALSVDGGVYIAYQGCGAQWRLAHKRVPRR